MVFYNCPRCNYSTEHKTKYMNHLKKKNICEPILSKTNLQKEYIKYNIIDKIQMKHNETSKELTKAKLETTKIENELQRLRYDLKLALAELNRVNQYLEETLAQKAQTEARLKIIQEQLNQAQAEKARTEAELNFTQNRLSNTVQQKETLRQEIQKLQIKCEKTSKD